MSDMSPRQMAERLDQVALRFQGEIAAFMDTARVRLAATATNEYMKDGGFTSPPFPPRKSRSGPLRILSGRLARSLTGSRSFTGGGNAHAENISEVSATEQGVKMRYGTKVPYANVHEEGFSGVVRIPAHQRTITQAFGQKIPAKTVSVREHRRSMFIPARPYLGPSLDDNLVWLKDTLAQQTTDLLLEVVDG